MSWRDRYRQGSFRGAPFITEEVEGTVGRRTQVHEYPQRDRPFTEDMGRLARSFDVQCFVAGPDYMDARDRLIDACEAEGPGTLVHPFRGQISVAVLDCRYRESAGEEGGGVATFTISFIESGAPVAAPVEPDSSAKLANVAEAVEVDAPAAFAERFDVSGLPAFVEEAAATVVSGAVLVASGSAALLGGVGPALRAFETGLSLLPTDAAALARTPIALGRALVGFVQVISALGGPPRRRADTFSALIDHTLALDPVIGATPARDRQRANQSALQALIVPTAAAGLVRAIGEVRFASYEEATATRDAAADRLDAAALVFADRGDDAAADTLDRLRRAMVQDVTARGGSLARVYSWRPSATLPALAIAQRLYGEPATIIERADSIVVRNRIRHPGFIPADRPLEVLTNG